MAIRDLLNEALKLPAEERGRLARELIRSLGDEAAEGPGEVERRGPRASHLGLPDLLPYRSEILRLTQARGLTNVRVFGSFVRGEAKEDSDVDLLVDDEAADRFGMIEHIRLISDLEAVVHRRVDLVTAKGLHRVVKDQVLREARPL